eukprot:COSAG01_NODE_604_length_14894_cov_24.503211_12_plen_159_part_00
MGRVRRQPAALHAAIYRCEARQPSRAVRRLLQLALHAGSQVCVRRAGERFSLVYFTNQRYENCQHADKSYALRELGFPWPAKGAAMVSYPTSAKARIVAARPVFSKWRKLEGVGDLTAGCCIDELPGVRACLGGHVRSVPTYIMHNIIGWVGSTRLLR